MFDNPIFSGTPDQQCKQISLYLSKMQDEMEDRLSELSDRCNTQQARIEELTRLIKEVN